MLVGAHQIGRARRGIEALGEFALVVHQIVADHGERRGVDRVRLAAVSGGTVLDMDDGEVAAQIVQKVGRRAVGAAKRRVRQRRA